MIRSVGVCPVDQLLDAFTHDSTASCIIERQEDEQDPAVMCGRRG